MTFTQKQFERLSSLMYDKGVIHEAFELLADLRISERNFAEKAQAYDRLMSGGKKTLKEMANFLGKPVTLDKSGAIYAHEFEPHMSFGDMWVSNLFNCMQISPNLIDFNGDWKDSLTLPDGWEEKCSHSI